MFIEGFLVFQFSKILIKKFFHGVGSGTSLNLDPDTIGTILGVQFIAVS